MRLPRIRLTIARLMALILLVGLASWYVFVHRAGLRERTVAERVAEANYRQARLAREVAELAAFEFERGDDRAIAEGLRSEAALAGSDIARAADRLRWSERMHSKGYVSKATRIADGMTLDQAGFEADQVVDRLESLTKAAKGRKLETLDAEIAKARAVEAGRLEDYEIERARRRSWWGF